ncbi:MAG TPA: phage holin family protein [Candidatus Paceibacterota bacterium]|nr:phage holin family protein [Verrucomicrobiota bacterium]HOX00884.1 phage holin family protein [Verrucomicrobiota bacterium]HRZ43591.1 phage holin family protein [Candidatus Paceibacterota bacterium]HRZ91610.1 phage holin family protein [Candidatus Paceibacterota bacterium]
MTPPAPGAPGPPGLLRGLGRALLGLFQNRLELAAIELSEERHRLLKTLFLGALLFFTGILAAATLTAAVAALCWDSIGRWLLLGFGLFYAAVAIALALALRRRLAQWPPFLATTIAEIKEDRHSLPPTFS